MKHNVMMKLLLSMGIFGTQGVVSSMNIQHVADVQELFSIDVAGMQQRVDAACAQAKKDIAEIIAIPDAERTFENTPRQIDRIGAQVSSVGVVGVIFESLSADQAMRLAGREAQQQISRFSLEYMGYNFALYRALEAYRQGAFQHETLSAEQRYYVEKSLKNYKRNGLELPTTEQQQLRTLLQELSDLSTQFLAAINEAQVQLTLTRDELKGLDAAFVATLKQTDDNYIVVVDYPSYDQVMANCAVESTRKAMRLAFANRGYPENRSTLAQIIAKRDKVAKMLGYGSYADLTLEDSMAGSVGTVEQFLQGLLGRAQEKARQELALLGKDLPEGVTLDNGRYKAWDMAYINDQYKKKHLAVDERAVAEYFPLEQTLSGLLSIYEEFLSVKFTRVGSLPEVHPDVQLVAVHKDGALLGYIGLDLHPRPFKRAHACQIGCVKAVKTDNGRTAAVAVVIASFPKPTDGKPALLRRRDVSTFFHEFGHALHTMFGATEMYAFSGTAVYRDFVELPSQMLEEWLWDAAMLKKVSCHYITGQPLSDEMIMRIQALKQYGGALNTLGQVQLARLSLACFKEGADKDVVGLKNNIYHETQPELVRDPHEHYETSFGHLMGYGASYYGYLWSQVYALDLFDTIKKVGLLDPEIGARYANIILASGGSRHPHDLLVEFLGRQPSSDAFFKELGI